MSTEARATGQWSFKQAAEAFFGTGTMVDLLKQAGTTDLARERLNIVVNTCS